MDSGPLASFTYFHRVVKSLQTEPGINESQTVHETGAGYITKGRFTRTVEEGSRASKERGNSGYMFPKEVAGVGWNKNRCFMDRLIWPEIL